MVELVKITNSQILIKNTSNQVLFDTNRKYIKTDPNGNFKAGGFSRIPVMTGKGSAIVDQTVLGAFPVFPSALSYSTGYRLGTATQGGGELKRWYLKVPGFVDIIAKYTTSTANDPAAGGAVITTIPGPYLPTSYISEDMSLYLTPDGTSTPILVGTYIWRSSNPPGPLSYGNAAVYPDFDITDTNTTKKGGLLVVEGAYDWFPISYGGGSGSSGTSGFVGNDQYLKFFVETPDTNLGMAVTP